MDIWCLFIQFSKFLLFRPHCLACGILLFQPGLEPALEVQSLNHWTAGEVWHMIWFFFGRRGEKQLYFLIFFLWYVFKKAFYKIKTQMANKPRWGAQTHEVPGNANWIINIDFPPNWEKWNV